jgi:ABC-type bacteriocin/lantibiotic exporters, contain an N-terminal double-glycine peptidase domain
VAAIFGTFAYIAWRTVQGTLSIGAMIMYYGAFQVGLSSLQQVLGGLAGLYEDNLFLTYFHEFQTLERTVHDPSDQRPVPRPMAAGIAFENVSFSYPDTDRSAIDNVSFAVRPGEVTALVGANGSGKTTSSSSAGSTTRSRAVLPSTAAICGSSGSSICGAP